MKKMKRYEVTFLNGGERCVDYWFAHTKAECRKVAQEQYIQDYGKTAVIVEIKEG